jgi:tRNA G18 (ribose-2'-O)-methylase SpoU
MFRKLSIHEMGRLSPEEYKNQKKIPLICILEDIRSHHNTGSVFRTCDAFACEAVYLCGITGTPPHRDIHKTALGATETVEWKYYQNSIDAVTELKNSGYKIVLLEIAEGSTLIDEFVVNPYDKIALVLGNEVNGISDALFDLADDCVEIPQYGTKHSLYVSVSAGIAIWTISKKYRNF